MVNINIVNNGIIEMKKEQATIMMFLFDPVIILFGELIPEGIKEFMAKNNRMKCP